MKQSANKLRVKAQWPSDMLEHVLDVRDTECVSVCNFSLRIIGPADRHARAGCVIDDADDTKLDCREVFSGGWLGMAKD